VFSSLRVRLPLIFIGGILLAALVTTAIAVQLYQAFAHDQTVSQLRHEADGIAQLYSNAVNDAFKFLGSTHIQMPHDHWRTWAAADKLGLHQ